MSLQDQLDAFKAEIESGRPPYNATRAAIDTMHRATAELKVSGQEARALKVGDKAPPFTLNDADGKPCVYQKPYPSLSNDRIG